MESAREVRTLVEAAGGIERSGDGVDGHRLRAIMIRDATEQVAANEQQPAKLELLFERRAAERRRSRPSIVADRFATAIRPLV